MTAPRVSVIFPARNESARLRDTLRSIVETRETAFELELVVVDDASTDGCCDDLALDEPGVTVTVLRLEERAGVPRARNHGARHARGDILFITDAHVSFSEGWDRLVFEHIQDDRILAATISDPTSGFRGYGCRLVVPFMGTHWNRERPDGVKPVQIASAAGTVLKRALFERIGGYDGGMLLYGSAEPELSVRAWLSGADIVSIPDLLVFHRFKPEEERDRFLDGLRPFMVHNCVRFGLLYLSEAKAMQMVRHFAMLFPDDAQEAFRLISESDVWERRERLRQTLAREFSWFVAHFNLRDQVEQEIR